MSGKKQIKQSETVVIKRSQINFAPYNPKKHSRDAIKAQLKNYENIGFLGGIVWNVLSNNLVSGHKRVMAMDLYYGYDGTTATDYDVKVERVELIDKQEKEQNIFMDAKSTNTAQDYSLLADLLPDIDYKLAGLDSKELDLIVIESPSLDFGMTDTAKNDYKELSQEYDEKKQHIKDVKKQMKNNVALKAGVSYVTLSFSTYENKVNFMEQYGYAPDDLYIKGEEFFDKINE